VVIGIKVNLNASHRQPCCRAPGRLAVLVEGILAAGVAGPSQATATRLTAEPVTSVGPPWEVNRGRGFARLTTMYLRVPG
jgi:hypothetical protein